LLRDFADLESVERRSVLLGEKVDPGEVGNDFSEFGFEDGEFEFAFGLETLAFKPLSVCILRFGLIECLGVFDLTCLRTWLSWSVKER